jgi:hypothetical protein
MSGPAALWLFWACTGACVIAHIGILRSVLRRPDDASPDVPHPRVGVEVIWSVVPMLALALVLLITLPRVRQHAYAPSTASAAQAR